MAVVMDLLQKGFSVFRSVSPSCAVDLVITKNGNTHSGAVERVLKVEVKTGHYTLGGKLRWPRPLNDKFDILAVVVHGEITYTPSLEDPR